MTKIVCCQYQVEKLSNWENYTTKIESLVANAKKEGAELLLMPEYAGTEIACNKFNTEYQFFSALQPLIPKYIEFYKRLSQHYQIYIQAGTIIEETITKKYVNRAYFFSPNGLYGYQDKLQFSGYEKSIKLLESGQQQKIFETSLGKIGIAICYDSEFPEIIQRLVHNGASIILVPSYTTTLAAYNRVFLSCRARAIENQCYVALSYIVNLFDLSVKTENTFGQAAILGPADSGFSDDGIIIQGKMQEIMLVTAEISLDKLALVRKHGEVQNFEDTMHCTSWKKNKIKLINLAVHS